MQQFIDEYKAAGFTVDVGAASAIGSAVLLNPSSNRVVKIGQDRAYALFVDLARTVVRPEFPRIFDHQVRDDERFAVSNSWTSITEMEVLRDLTPDEGVELMAWIKDAFRARQAGVPWTSLDEDPFMLAEALQLVEAHLQAGPNRPSLDLIKPQNFMARDAHGHTRIVITDPYF